MRGKSTTDGEVADHMVLAKGNTRGARGLAVRVHSECMTSEVFGSLKCDCAEQLAMAQAEVESRGEGMVIYLRQEGRGIGIAAKIRAYNLQDQGLDTVDANTAQGLPVDARQYDVAAAILADLGVESVRLLSNNPAKAAGLVEHGIQVDELVPAIVALRPERAGYLRTKSERLGHVGL